MRTILCMVCAAVLAWAGTSVALEVDAPRLFADLDANGDGRLTGPEAGPPHARLFARLLRTSDANGDEQLDVEEFATALTPVRAEKELVAKQGSRLPGSDALVVMLAMMDADGNRQLVAEEVPERLRQVFALFLQQADADKNGRLDVRELGDKGPQLAIVAQAAAARLGIDVAAELEKLPSVERQAMEQMGAQPRLEDLAGDPKQALAFFERLDANGDKALSADETPEGLAARLNRGDRDGDGKLSLAEFQAMTGRMAANDPPADPAASRRQVRQLLRRFDRNGDGKLGRNEAPPRIATNFDRLDQDGDGQLASDELERAAAAMAQAPPPAVGRPRPAKDEEMQ